MALTALTKDFLARSGLSVEGTNIVTTATYTSGLQTGTFQVAGGGAIGKNLIVGSTATVYGATNLLSTLNVTGSSVLANLTATVFTATSANILGNETVGGNVVITSNNAATGASNASGSLQVTGGAGIGGALYVGGSTYIGGDLFVDGTQFVVNKQAISSGDATLTLSTGSANASLAANAGLQIGSTSSPYITWLYDGVANWVSSGGVKVSGSTLATSTATGALQVVGGVGIGGNLIVGAAVTATNFYGYLGGANGTANLYGGATGSLVYQSAANTTAFLPAGTNGYVLEMVSGLPSWASVSGLSAGNANTATNIAGGLANQIPYQSAPGLTTFNSNLVFNGTTFTTTNVTVTSSNQGTTYSSGNALQVTGGVGIGGALYVNNTSYINGAQIITTATINTYANQTSLTAGTDTAVSSSTGNITIWDTSTLQSVTGRGAATTNAITINNATAATSTITGALIITNGGIGLGGSVYAGGSVTAGTGLYSIGTYGGTYTDGIVVDYATGNGRVSVGSNDNITFYAGGLAATQTVQISSTGTVTIAGTANSVSTTTGALQVAGCVGVAGNVYAIGTVTAGGPAVSGTSVNAFVSNNFELASYTSSAITTTGGTTLLDTYAIATYRTAEYLVQLWDSSTNSIHSEKIMVTTDGTNVFITEYAVVTNNGELGTFDAGLSTGVITLKFTASSASNLVIKVVRTSITA